MLTLQELIHTLAAGQRSGSLHAENHSIGFQELARSAKELALNLAPLQGQRVVLTAEPGIDFVRHLLACWQVGALPLLVDTWTGAHLEQAQLNQLGASAAWHAGQWQKLNAESGRHWPELPLTDRGPQTPALVLLTSGSSGRPKGVVLTHQQILANLQAVATGMELDEPDSVGVMLPLHHSFALITQLLLTLWTGGEIHLLPPLPGERLAYLQAQQIHRLAGVPTHFRLLLDDSALRLPQLRHLKVAGAALDAGLAGRILEACPAATLWVGYGLTEAGPRVSAVRHQDPRFATGSAGQALPGITLRIVEGELQVRSPANMAGYLDAPEATAAVLDQGWLSTGDSARLEDGYLYILGRSDELFMVAGEKIAPLEIENVLLGCEGVSAAAVYGEPDAVFGHKLVALIQGEVDLPALRRHMRRQLAPEKRPQSWYAVSGLPLTANGKLRRKELPQWPRQAFMTPS